MFNTTAPHRHVRQSAVVAGTGALLLFAAACASGASGSGGSSSGGNSSSGGSAAKSSSAGPAVSVRSTSLGKVLVDSKGRTLYMFTIDKPGKSNCTGACLKYWPVAKAPSGKPAAASTVMAKLGVTTARDGSRQLTAGGWPLYLYVGDKSAGDVHGQGVKTFGGSWYVLSAAGSPIKGTAKSAGASSSPSSGGSSGGGGWG